MAAVWPSLQGILLTAEALGFFVAAMMLIPKVKMSRIAARTASTVPAPILATEQPATPPAIP